jgi:uncharacterized protein
MHHPPIGSLLDNPFTTWQVGAVSLSKLEKLRELLRSYGSCLVAYSGGVDSVFLARVARDALGERALAAIADSPSLPRRELEEALAIARQLDIPVRVVRTAEFENPNYLANPGNRCYYCKHELFTELAPLARAEKLAVITYGENASDAGDDRPGRRAAAEFEVRAPLKEAGLTKAEIRALSAQLGLPTADKPQMACLSSRIPHGEPVTTEKLKMIEDAENLLRDLGFYDVRVRLHELHRPVHVPKIGSGLAQRPEAAVGELDRGTVRYLARIEVGAAEAPRLLADELRGRVTEGLTKIGCAHVTLDLRGYRGASLAEVRVERVAGDRK